MSSIDKVLDKVTDDDKANRLLFLTEFNDLTYEAPNKNNLLHIVIFANSDILKKKMALYSLINAGVDTNHKNNEGDTFIHMAIRKNIDIDSLISIIRFAYKHGYDINSVNDMGQTILHTGISYMKNYIDILKLTQELGKYGFDYRIKDRYNNSLYKYIDWQKRFSSDKRRVIKNIIENEVNKMDDNTEKEFNENIFHEKVNINESNKDLINKGIGFAAGKFGKILNSNDYQYDPAIGRDKEIFDIILSLATDKKLPLLVGESGVGKTAIIDQITYMIQKNKVPDFLKNRIIYEVLPTNIVAGTKYRGDFEQNMKSVLDFCTRNNAILFLDEFHTIYGTGSVNEDKTDIATILKSYIDRYNLCVIGATTPDEYQKIMTKDALKRRFEVIKINELAADKLFIVISNIIFNNSKSKNIVLSDNIVNNYDYIVNLLIELTSKEHRRYDDMLSNPDLIISIIDRAFAYAKIYNDKELKLEYLISSIESSEKIYGWTKTNIINKLNEIDNIHKNNDNIIVFKTYKKNISR